MDKKIKKPNSEAAYKAVRSSRDQNIYRPGIKLKDSSYLLITDKDGVALCENTQFNAIKLLVTEIDQDFVRLKFDLPHGVNTEATNNKHIPQIKKLYQNINNKKKIYNKLVLSRYVGQAIHIYADRNYKIKDVIDDLKENGIIIQVSRARRNIGVITFFASKMWDIKRCEIDNRYGR